jgi:hypothetical protein
MSSSGCHHLRKKCTLTEASHRAKERKNKGSRLFLLFEIGGRKQTDEKYCDDWDPTI